MTEKNNLKYVRNANGSNYIYISFTTWYTTKNHYLERNAQSCAIKLT